MPRCDANFGIWTLVSKGRLQSTIWSELARNSLVQIPERHWTGRGDLAWSSPTNGETDAIDREIPGVAARPGRRPGGARHGAGAQAAARRHSGDRHELPATLRGGG